jgi:ABC-2 type transport system ATP-binding protein
MVLLEVKGLRKYYGSVKAVDGIEFQIQEGEVFGLLGPNGAGKSTAISMISSLIAPTAGEIFFMGKSILEDSGELKQNLGVVPQEIALYPTLTGYQNLAFWGGMYGLRGSLLKKRIEEVREIIGLNNRLRDRVDKYSGGMKRRLNIGAALLHKPKLLIMDEPTVGIDPQSRNHILDTVLELNRGGTTIFYTSHYMEEVEYLCDRICIMDQGKIIASGTKEELVNIIKGQTQVSIKTEKVDKQLLEGLKSIRGVSNAEFIEGSLVVTGKDIDLMFPEIIAKVGELGGSIKSIDVNKPDLEAVFLHLTGKALRD